MPIRHIGQVSLSISSNPLKLNNVLYVLALKYNLLFVQKLWQDNNCGVSFDSSSVYIKDKQIRTTLLWGSNDGGIYNLSFSSLVSTFATF